MNYSKPFKEISELLEILKNRRLIINDYQFATDFLHNVNYFPGALTDRRARCIIDAEFLSGA